MLGIKDPGIYWAYILTILSLVACLVYGILYWNKGKIQEDEQQETAEWSQKEDEINEDF
jgi:hypothetical protein